MPAALTHVALHVRDVEANVRFYEEFCGMRCVHRRSDAGAGTVVWMAEPGREDEFILVFISGGASVSARDDDFSHFGFAVDRREQVDAVAERARKAGCLVWPPRQEPYPVGYYCGILDPNGNRVEFSYGQPLGPGAEPLREERVGEPADGDGTR